MREKVSNLVQTAGDRKMKELLAIAENILKEIQIDENIFLLTTSRRFLLQKLLSNVKTISSHQITPVHYGRILVGQRGCGKTWFLKVFQLLVNLMFPNVIVFYHFLSQSPDSAIRSILQDHFQIQPEKELNVYEILKRTFQKGYRVIFLIDEAHHIFPKKEIAFDHTNPEVIIKVLTDSISCLGSYRKKSFKISVILLMMNIIL